ncbi:MAG TPA: hypothetical protein VG899_10045 [Mycobacteriales bacterium]|nr:hypothetical protein [Mycobacteriales bacterium]
MNGPAILARFLTEPGPPDKYGNRWQYHSRSDRHSKVGCWGVALDLLATSSLLRRHVEAGKVILGVNHTMTDFATSRKKDLDLVIARPAGDVDVRARTFASLADQYGIVLTDLERGVLDALPRFPVGPAGAVLVALEAKACMTAHVKSLPRLYDELNSSHLCVHGASRQALAIGYVQINNADEFISPVLNNRALDGGAPEITRHRQPADSVRVLTKVAEIPRRSASSEVGFDGIGVTLLELRNDGSPVEIVERPPAPPPGDSFHYASMIVRMANEYDTTFANI